MTDKFLLASLIKFNLVLSKQGNCRVTASQNIQGDNKATKGWTKK